MADLTPAKAGDRISEKARKALAKRMTYRMRGALVDLDALSSTQEHVEPKTPSNKYGGQWFCIDCGELPQNNMMAWSHADKHSKRTPHRFAWRNADNGGRIEEP